MLDRAPSSVLLFLLVAGLMGVGSAPAAYAQDTIYVDAGASDGGDGTSWDSAYQYLQDALEAASEGDDIWIAEGVYYPDRSEGSADNQSGFLVTDAIDLYGGFSGSESTRSARDPQSNVVVLSGDVDQDDTTNQDGVTEESSDISGTNWPVLFAGNTGNGARLDGLTITGGDGEQRRTGEKGGGGMVCGSNCNLTLRNVNVTGNRTSLSESAYGGGIFLRSSGGGSPGELRIFNATFSGNKASFGGGAIGFSNTNVSESTLLVEGSTFRNNTSEVEGGAIHSFRPIRVKEATFLDNATVRRGGAIHLEGDKATLHNVRLFGNKAIRSLTGTSTASPRGGGIFVDGTTTYVANAVFSGNESDEEGSALYVLDSGSEVFLSTVTISQNAGDYSLFLLDSTQVENTIIWGNKNGIFAGRDGITFSHTIVENGVRDGADGGGNLEQDPQLKDPSGADGVPGTLDDNLRISSSSPALDAGIESGLADDRLDLDADGDTSETVPIDLDGTLRVQGEGVDMGAYEFGDEEGGESLEPPVDLTASAGDQFVELSWNPGGSSSPDGYNVYRSTSSFNDVSNATKLNSSPVGSNAYTDSGLTNGTTYYYRVTAVSTSGSESNPSEEASATPQVEESITVTSPNGGESWLVGTTHDITWSTRNLSNQSLDISLLKGGTETQTIASETVDDGVYEWTIPSDLATGSDYKVRISAVDGSASDQSDATFAITADAFPSAPTGFAATAGDQKVHLFWDANSGEDITGYNLYRSTSSFTDTTNVTRVNGSPLTRTSYRDAGLTNGTEYYYRLAAINAEGDQGKTSAEVQASPTEQSVFITSFHPTSGAPGTTVRIRGGGFSSTAGENTATFGSVQATVTQAKPDVLQAEVPSSSSGGPMEVTVASDGETATAGELFSVATEEGTSFIEVGPDFRDPKSIVASSIADLNQDGLLDLLVSGVIPDEGLTITLYFQQSDGSFEAEENLDGITCSSAPIADINGDGRPDLVATRSDNVPTVYIQQKDGSFTQDKIELENSTGDDNPFICKAADVNGDGAVDLIGSDIYLQKPNGNFTTGGAGLSISSIDPLVDVNEDGLLDFLDLSNNKLYLQKPDGSFDEAGVSLPALEEIGSGVATSSIADINGDGARDILIAVKNGNSITELYLQESDGTFSEAEAGLEGSEGTIADVNGDGVLDILTAGKGENGEIGTRLYLQQSDGTFEEIESGLTGITYHPVEHPSIADVNQDGALDILVAGETKDGNPATILQSTKDFLAPSAPTGVTASARDKQVDVAWDANPERDLSGYVLYRSTSSFSDTTAATRITDSLRQRSYYADTGLSNDATYYYRIVAVDKRGKKSKPSNEVSATPPYEGPMSLRVSSVQPEVGGQGTTVEIFGTGFGSSPEENSVTFGETEAVVTEATNRVLTAEVPPGADPGPSSVAVTVGEESAQWDARFDLLAPGQGGEFSEQSVIGEGAFSFYAEDLNGDGDLDILASKAGKKIVWYENEGDGTFSEQKVITRKADGVRSVYAADLNGDGDPDVLSASNSDDNIAWYENEGDGTFLNQKVITTSADGAWSVYARDLDGDGDADVLSASINDNKIALYENLGGEFSEQKIITTNAENARSVYARDLDGDGDADVLSASRLDDKIAWYENVGGRFSEQKVITRKADGARSVYTADLNGDGDPDVLSASSSDDKIAWYENQEDGTFLNQKVITTTNGTPSSVFARDLDGDGDADVLARTFSSDPSRIRWYENFSNKPPARPTALTAQPGNAQVSLSWDENGEEDLAGYNLYRSTSSFTDTSNATQVNSSPLTGTSYTDTGLSNGTTYYYRLTAVNTSGGESRLSSVANAYLQRQIVETDIERSFGDASGPGDYRLVALPGAPNRPLDDAISGEPGAEWQAYWDDGTGFVRYDDSDPFAFEKGRGFWLVSRQDWTATDSIDTAVLQDSTTGIPLNDGWTIVANPFGESVSWSALRAANDGNLEALWPFEGAFNDTSAVFASAATGKAYYLLNNVSDRDSLRVPHPALIEEKTRLRASREKSKKREHSYLFLSATLGDRESKASTVRLGLSETDSTGRPLIAPPGGLEAVSLRIQPDAAVPLEEGQQSNAKTVVHRAEHTPKGVFMDGSRDRSQFNARSDTESDGDDTPLLMADQRVPENGGVIYRLRLERRVEGPVRLTVRRLQVISDREAVLLRPTVEKTHDLREEKAITVEPGEKTTELKVAIGTERYVQEKREEVLPDEVELTTYPNPVRRQGTIEYALPKQRKVSLRVYDVLGRRVATLVSGTKEAGRHTVQLATDNLSSGIYFGRLKTDSRTLTQKIVVVR